MVAVGPPPDHGQREVELRRREADDRGAVGAARRSVAGGHAPVASAPSGAEGLAQREPLPHRERLRAAVRLDRRPPRAPPSTRAGVDRELPGEHVVEHLAALAEARLDQAPELVFRDRVEPVVAVVRLDHDDGGLDRGLGSKAPGGTRIAIRTRAWYCTKTDR